MEILRICHSYLSSRPKQIWDGHLVTPRGFLQIHCPQWHSFQCLGCYLSLFAFSLQLWSCVCLLCTLQRVTSCSYSHSVECKYVQPRFWPTQWADIGGITVQPEIHSSLIFPPNSLHRNVRRVNQSSETEHSSPKEITCHQRWGNLQIPPLFSVLVSRAPGVAFLLPYD